jgi:hypothetical protein
MVITTTITDTNAKNPGAAYDITLDVITQISIQSGVRFEITFSHQGF